MTLDECIAYLENVSSERKPRSRKARQILNYLQEYKAILDMQNFKRRYKERGEDADNRAIQGKDY